MGIETDRFVSVVPQDAYCITCGNILEDPVEIVDCGHVVCCACWDNIIAEESEESDNKCVCPFCGIVVLIHNVRKASLTWNLIQNMEVFCKNKKFGCECIYKYTFDKLHRQKCAYGGKEHRDEPISSDKNKCSTCGITYENERHDCSKELVSKLKRQAIQITNLEMENSRIAFKLATREKRFPEEGKFYMESLKYDKEIRDLRTRLAVIQGEIGRRKGDCKFHSIHISLERVEGSLGFNIIGGTSSKDENNSSGIYVSRIVEGGAADQPGKLQLHDHIIEVDGLDLRSATHALAVQTFRNSGDPVKMTIQRQIKRNTTCDVSTQTFGVMFAVTGEENSSIEKEVEKNIRNKSPWLTLHDFNEKDSINASLGEPVELLSKEINEENKDESKSELYDSAYDTLLTQKSSRSIRPLSSNEQSDFGSDKQQKDEANVSIDKLEKRRSTFFVIPGSDNNCDEKEAWEDSSAAEREMEYEYEYEEVVLEKAGGKFGLLLCYGGDATDVAVYVGDMEENSVADTSGKIMVGDQIVQINGCHVSDVDQAYQMLQENEEIALIVARAVYEVQSEFYDDAEETDLDMLDSIMEENESTFEGDTNGLAFASSISTSTSVSSTSANSRLAINPFSLSNTSTSTEVQVHSKRAETSVKTISHNFSTVTESTIVDVNKTEKVSTINVKNEKDSVKNSLKNFVKNALGHSEKKDKRNNSNSDDSCDVKFQRSDSNSNSSTASTQRKHSNASQSQESTKSQDSLEALKCKLKEQKQMSKMKAYVDSPSLNRHRSNTHIPNSQTNPLYYPNPSFEYVPIHPVQNQVPPSLVFENPENILHNHSMHRPHNRTSVACSTSSLKSAMKNSHVRDNMNSSTKTTKHVQIDPHPDWNETERRVWEEFKIIQSMEAKETKGHDDNMKIEAEWRVRRSKDGKHIYIKKTNSSRSKMLKEREKQVDMERCGITTDDDAFTVYQGHYWNKDQRRRQLNRHNDRKKRLDQKAADKALYENKTEKVMAEMVQRKMTLPGKVFDNFITVEEILSQRNRSGIFEGPIHVTTI